MSATFRASLSAGCHIPLRDSPKRAAFGLSAREDAAENFEAAIMLGDGVERARAHLDGRILVGELGNVQRVRLAPWRFEHRFELRSVQRGLRVRVRDELNWADDTRLRALVTDVHRLGGKLRSPSESSTARSQWACRPRGRTWNSSHECQTGTGCRASAGT